MRQSIICVLPTMDFVLINYPVETALPYPKASNILY